MNTIFSFDSPVIQFLYRIFDVICLNLLCLLCCIPVITIGPSVTALYYCAIKIIREPDFSIGKMFFHSFKTNLKQGILLTVLFIAVAVFLFLDIHICTIVDVSPVKYIRILLYVLCVAFALIVSYTFPLLAQFKNTIRNLIKNALLLSIGNIGYTFIIVILNAAPWVLLFLLPELFIRTFPVWLFFGFSAIALINSKLFVKIFDKYSPEFQKSQSLIDT